MNCMAQNSPGQLGLVLRDLTELNFGALNEGCIRRGEFSQRSVFKNSA